MSTLYILDTKPLSHLLSILHIIAKHNINLLKHLKVNSLYSRPL